MNVLNILKSHKNEINTKYDVKMIGIFCSYVKGIGNEESDVEILVDFEKHSFDKFMRLSFYLEELFHKKVDILTPNSLNPFIKTSVEKRGCRVNG